MQYVFIDDINKQYLINLAEIENEASEKKFDVIRIFHSDDADDFTEYEIQVYLLEGTEVKRKPLNKFSKEFKEALGDESVKVMPKIFVANPYFEEMMIFFGDTVYTSKKN